MTDNDKLCRVCQSLLATTGTASGYDSSDYEADSSDSSIYYRGYRYNPTVGYLHTSAQKGCPLCAYVWDGFLFRYPTLDRSLERAGKAVITCTVKLTPYDGRTPSRHGVPPMYQFYIKFAKNQAVKLSRAVKDYPRWVNIYAFPVKTPEAFPRAEPTPNTGSEETWNVASRWLQECRTNHVKCNKNSHSKWCPKRVLEVGTTSTPTLHLYITDQSSPASPYVTLSHCWGQLKIIRLLEANISQYVESIDVAELPKTFQDAIVVARRLGVRYIWIDSLCIIQDSLNDWAQESITMGDVYQNALCNIAATAAADGRTGLFLERDPLLGRTCRVDINTLPGPASTSGVYDLVDPRFWESGINNAPLLQRAWVLQERTMAPRIIHFGQRQLFWECHELDACEMFPNSVPSTCLGGTYSTFGFKHLDPATDGPRIRESPGFTFNIEDKSMPLDETADAFILWNGIVQTYAKCLLTNRTDKLIAISAIARQFQSILNDDYRAGLWRRHLVQHILWSVLPNQAAAPSGKDSDEYCAPSWSWASVRGPVSPYSSIAPADRPAMIQILDVKLQTLTPDPLGPLSGGHIKLRGWLKGFPRPFESIDSDDSDDPNRANSSSWAMSISKNRKPICQAKIDQLPLPENRDWYCLPVLNTFGKAYLNMDLKKTIGLILLPTGKEHEYRRVGMFEAVGPSVKAFARPVYSARASQESREDDTGRDPKYVPGSVRRRTTLASLFSSNDLKVKVDVIPKQLLGPVRRKWWRLRIVNRGWTESVIMVI